MDYLRFLRVNWLYLSAGLMLALGSSYGQTFFISLFATQIKGAFSLTDGGWGLAYTLGTCTSAVLMVWAGVLTDRFRIRALAVWIMLGLAGACLMITQGWGFGWLVLCIFLLRFFGQGMMSHLAVVAMSRWFVATRGKALSISSLGFAIGTAFLPIIFVAMLKTTDWRWLWVVAALITVATIPVILWLLRQERTPQSIAEDTQALGMDARQWQRGEVIRHPVFWLLVPALLGPPAWGTALFFHQVHLNTVKGWDHLAYVSLFPAMMGMAVATTFTAGWAIDRYGSARLLPLYLMPFVLSFLVMGLTGSLAVGAIALVIFGMGQGMQGTLATALWSEFFGTQHIGGIKAIAGAIMVFGSAIGPGITGILIDWGIGFPTQLIWLAGYFVIAGVLATLAGRIAAARLTAPA